jgi:hypothetical protein
VFKKLCILGCQESLDQHFRDSLVGDGDPIVHKEFPHHLIFLGINDRVGIQRTFFEGLIIREMVGVVEKEKGPGEEKKKKRKEERIDDIERPSLRFAAFRLIRGHMIFHEERMGQKREDAL